MVTSVEIPRAGNEGAESDTLDKKCQSKLHSPNTQNALFMSKLTFGDSMLGQLCSICSQVPLDIKNHPFGNNTTISHLNFVYIGYIEGNLNCPLSVYHHYSHKLQCNFHVPLSWGTDTAKDEDLASMYTLYQDKDPSDVIFDMNPFRGHIRFVRNGSSLKENIH
jgi:hypothetical protein